MQSGTVRFSIETSKLIYCTAVILSPVLMQLTKYSSKRILNCMLTVFAFIILLVPMGLRTGGIDHTVYRYWYDAPNIYLFPYKGTPEPLFFLLILFSKYVLNSFQFIYLFSAFVFLLGLFSFVKRKCDDYFTAMIFVLCSIYMFLLFLRALRLDS